MCVRSIIILLQLLVPLQPCYFGGKATSESIRRGNVGHSKRKETLGEGKRGEDEREAVGERPRCEVERPLDRIGESIYWGVITLDNRRRNCERRANGEL